MGNTRKKQGNISSNAINGGKNGKFLSWGAWAYIHQTETESLGKVFK